MNRVVIYARVSTSNGTQDYTRQVNDLTTVTIKNKWTLRGIFAEKISGAKKNEERAEFMRMVDYVTSHNIDKVLITETSRFGRNPLQVLSALEILNEKGVSVYIQNYNIETLNADGTINPMSQFMLTLLSEFARTERTVIRERVASGYANYRANGGKVGRKCGYVKSVEVMREQYGKEIQLLRKDYSLRNISAITGTSVNTLRKIKTII